MGTPNTISEVSICNLALSRMGSTQLITSITGTQLSPAASQCQVWYPQDRDALLSDFPWPFAEAYMVLNEVAGPETTQTRANAQWLRSYRYPPDCLKMRRCIRTPPPFLSAGIPTTTGNFGINYMCNEPWRRAVGDAYPVSYGLGNDANGKLIVSDWYGPYGITAIYGQAVSDPTQFETDFVDTLAWRLAADLAMGLGFDDKKRKYAEEMYERTIRKARATHMNELQSDIPFLRRQSEVIRARWGG